MLVCPKCSSSKIKKHTKYISVVFKRRALMESKKITQERLRKNDPHVYQETLRLFDGKWPTRKELEDSYSEQRYKCGDCNFTFREGTTTKVRNEVSSFAKADARILSRLKWLLGKKFLKKSDFLKSIRGTSKRARKNIKHESDTEFNSDGYIKYQFDPKRASKVYDEHLLKKRFSGSNYSSSVEPKEFYCFVLKRRNSRRRINVEIILLVYRKSLRVKRIFFSHEIEIYRKILKTTNADTPTNFDKEFSKMIGCSRKKTEIPEIENKIFLILKRTGFDDLMKIGGSAQESYLNLISNYFYFLIQFKNIFKNKQFHIFSSHLENKSRYGQRKKI